MIANISFKHSIPDNAIVLDVTSRSNSWAKAFSPFLLGPIELYNGYKASNLENGYQFTKVFRNYSTTEGFPSDKYFEWAQNGWNNPKPIKYPEGAWSEPLYHWWDGKKLSRLEAQNQIFLPLYKKAIIQTEAFSKLKELYETSEQDIYLQDFEGFLHKDLGLTWKEVINNPDRPVGQGFALCMILEGFL